METLLLKRVTEAKLIYIRNTCHYIVTKDDPYEVVGFGGWNVAGYDPYSAYLQMVQVRKYYGKLSGNPLIHIIVSFDEHVQDEMLALNFADRIAKFYKDSFQVLWGVHKKRHGRSNYHMHMVINAVSYVNGRMFHSDFGAVNQLANHIRNITHVPVRSFFVKDEDSDPESMEIDTIKEIVPIGKYAK